MSLAEPTRIPTTAGSQIWASLHAAGLDAVPVSVTPDAVEVDASVSADTLAQVQAVVAAYDPTKAALVPPDCGSLAYWLTALDLWQRKDSSGNTGAASAQVQASINALIAAKNPAGTLAARQFNSANVVLLADLLKIAPAFGFSPADCEESLWRANQVSLGDLTGTWPLPSAPAAQ